MAICAYYYIFLKEKLMKRESKFQRDLIDAIESIFPGCMVLKNDPNYIQGIPDLLVLYENKWAALEVKRSANEHRQPNQEYYISKMNNMSYASFVYPENMEDVLYELQQALRPGRATRVPKR